MTVTTIVRDSGTESTGRQLAVAEFFAGVGLARMGLEAAGFEVVWSNDFDRDKVSMYKGHFGTSDDREPDARSIAEVHASDLPDMGPSDGRWWDEARAKAFMAELSPVNLARIEDLRLSSQPTYRTAYRRTRQGKPSWEIRPDDIAGCLRTARGRSSKQAVVQAKDGVIRVRWMTPREYARLMGADGFKPIAEPLTDVHGQLSTKFAEKIYSSRRVAGHLVCAYE
ncbi:MAG: DNA cytosine methyltransferase [Trebonia sp.]